MFSGQSYLESILPGSYPYCAPRTVSVCGGVLADILFRYTTKSFGPMMAKAARLTIVEAENIVEVGSIDPNDVDLPGIFIDRIVPATVDSQPEILKTRSDSSGKDSAKGVSDAQQRRDRIARRAAKELKHGSYVNLGVGRDYTPQAAPTGQTFR